MKGGFLRDDMTGAIVMKPPKGYSRKRGQPGVVVPDLIDTSAQTFLTSASRAYAMRMMLDEGFTLQSIFYVVTGAEAVAGDTVNFSVDEVRDDDSLHRLYTLGALAGKLNGAGPKEIDVGPLDLLAGKEYKVRFSTSVAVTILGVNVAVANAYKAFGSSNARWEFEQQAAGHAHPDPFVPSGAPTATILPKLWLRDFAV